MLKHLYTGEMIMNKKAIAVMTSGGDSPGMNAAARAVVRTALHEGVDVYGIYNGYKGLLDDEIEKLTSRSVSDMIQRGGTFLGTARSMEFKTPEGRKKGYDNLQKHGIEGLVIIGGDGSLTGGSLLSKEHGVPIVGLPGTIDNDVWGTDYTIGADTAANTILDAINKLRDTASAHRRIMIVEVMGRTSGWLAMMTAIAGGAEYVLVPEAKYDLDEMCRELKEIYDQGKRYSIIVVAEGACSAVGLGDIVREKTGIDTRVSILGHIQRGGSPTVEDRIKASMLGEKAALAIISGVSDVVFGFDMGKVVSINLFDAVNNQKTLDPELVRLARVLA
jgi:6-phosphofructokinase 1